MQRIALILSILALAISVVAFAGRKAGPPAATAPRTPATLKLSMVVATFSGQGVAAHRWYPTMFVARVGDTVDLAIGNPDRFNHRFELTGYNLSTKKLTPGASASIRFTADRSGVFAYHCTLPHNPATGDCTPDHELMRGYLIVTE
ncbi:MAG TPA: hypothetical protein VFJ45_04620 [bacterium]|nr:hypothetical protein [bacterium]